ncbi:MAG: serine protease [Polyangia bacterium]|jgi:hypothetical protein
MKRTPFVMKTVLAALFLTAATEAESFALPVGTPEEAQQAASQSPTWDELDAAGVDFTSIVALSNCSGSLVRFSTSKTDDYAMVLTNGHCLSGFVPAGTAIVDQSSSRTFTLLDASARSLGTLRAQRMLYATMTGSDFAIYRLTQTYAQLASRYRVAPLVISSSRPTEGTAIRIASGFWKKIYSCSIDRFVPELREGTWTFRDSIRFTQPGCETIGGTSGSPIIDFESRAVIGINNTGNETGASCTMNNPCEVDSAGRISATKGAAYGQQLYQIYACLDASNNIDLTRTGCTLQKPK